MTSYKRLSERTQRKLVTGVALLLLIVAVPLSVYISRQEQDIRQKAAGTCTEIVQQQAGSGGAGKPNGIPGTEGVSIDSSSYCTTKTIRLYWDATPTATYYKLLINNTQVYLGPNLSYIFSNPTVGVTYNFVLYAGNSTAGDFNPSTGAFIKVVTPTPTPTSIPTPTFTPTPTPSNTPTPTPTLTPSPTPTLTPTPTPLPTATPTPKPKVLQLSLLFHGIGASGDNVLLEPPACKRTNGVLADPAACLSNQTPLHPGRVVTVELYDGNDLLITSTTGNVTYNSQTGTFMGEVMLGNSVANGTYNIKIQSPRYLKRQVTGFHTLTAGTSYTVPTSDLVSGDVDLDNKLTILDYNIIITCYTFVGLPPTCEPEAAAETDLTDDGKNDEFDENLFRRDLLVQYGQ